MAHYVFKLNGHTAPIHMLTKRAVYTAFAGLVFVSALAVPLQIAHANESEPRVEAILGAAPTPCNDEAGRLIGNQLVRLAPDQILDGIRPRLKKGTNWKSGVASYERARAIVADVLSNQERTGGPLYTLTAEKLWGVIASDWSAEEKRYYATFFSTPVGKLYLTDLFDSAFCLARLNNAISPPFRPLEGADKARHADLLASIETGRGSFSAKFQRLSNEERTRLVAAFEKLEPVFKPAFFRLTEQEDAEIKLRLKGTIALRMREIESAASESP